VNVRRGLLRLWMVCSIAWICLRPASMRSATGLSQDIGLIARFEIARDVARDWESSIRPHLEWAFGPPCGF